MILSFSRTSENVYVFVLVKFLECISRRAEVFSRVEFSRFFGKDFSDCSGHGKTAVAVDIDLADGTCGSTSELFFGNADRVFELSAVSIDNFYQILRN